MIIIVEGGGNVNSIALCLGEKASLRSIIRLKIFVIDGFLLKTLEFYIYYSV